MSHPVTAQVMEELAKDQSAGQPLSLGKLAEIKENVLGHTGRGPRGRLGNFCGQHHSAGVIRCLHVYSGDRVADGQHDPSEHPPGIRFHTSYPIVVTPSSVVISTAQLPPASSIWPRGHLRSRLIATECPLCLDLSPDHPPWDGQPLPRQGPDCMGKCSGLLTILRAGRKLWPGLAWLPRG